MIGRDKFPKMIQDAYQNYQDSFNNFIWWKRTLVKFYLENVTKILEFHGNRVTLSSATPWNDCMLIWNEGDPSTRENCTMLAPSRQVTLRQEVPWWSGMPRHGVNWLKVTMLQSPSFATDRTEHLYLRPRNSNLWPPPIKARVSIENALYPYISVMDGNNSI